MMHRVEKTGISSQCNNLHSHLTPRIAIYRTLYCIQFLALCAVPVTHGHLTLDGPTLERSLALDTLENLNTEIGRLASKVEGLTHQVEGLLTTADEKPATNSLTRDNSEELSVTSGEKQESDELQEVQQPDLSASGAEAVGEDARESRSSDEGDHDWWNAIGYWPRWLTAVLFLHEAWIFMQHANVLCNPLCQRLDRGYGIALLKRRMYWVIATVLAAYWAREVFSMLLALAFVSAFTRKMLLISTVYHVAKIFLILVDAKRGWSPTLGIMRLLIDHWHLSTVKDLLLSFKRIALQGFDTVTHALILRDMIRWDEEMVSGSLGLRRALVLLFPIWAIHAIGNLMTRKSTATLVVEAAKALVGKWGRARDRHRNKTEGSDFGALDGGRAEFACTSSCSHGHKRCEVCHLLTRDQPLVSRLKRID